ncbi:MAG: hypothetical protein GY873_30305 [Bosea sp.]|uniref:hypothetical protein n=1 Tax=Bosea sp. (in: a-proteobacteria) TaxID=1871050 RepID=UPI00239C5295|nr:hypothetical protein [Bosea sp. (in: a-proteobacteria)]MCP4738489.1 hypothetical protein [Bosea sp. (in: a-proteobacteria)]
MSPNPGTVEAMLDDVDDPWAVLAYGHHDVALLGSAEWRDRFVDVMVEMGGCDRASAREYVAAAPISQFWIVDTTPEGEEPRDYPYQFCGPEMPGAIAVTGVKFQ